MGLQSASTSTGFDAFVQMFQERIQSLFRDDRPDCVIVCISEAVGDLRVENPGLGPVECEALWRLQAEEEGDQLSLFAPTPEEFGTEGIAIAARAVGGLERPRRTSFKDLSAMV